MQEATYQTLILERPLPHVALVRLNRPDKHNAINARLSAELIHCLDRLEADGDIRVIVLTGAGEKSFCAGADMAESVQAMAAGGGRDAAAQAAVRLARVRKPVIAAVNGYAYGGGAVFAIACDIRICSEAASFRFVGATYGLVVGASRLPAIVGAAVAKDLIFTARVVGAAEAQRIGLANRVVPPGGLEREALGTAAEIAANDPAAVAASKEVIDLATLSQEVAKRELEQNVRLRQSDEHRSRFRAAARRVTGGESQPPAEL